MNGKRILSKNKLKYDMDLQECKKQIMMSMDYFNDNTKKVHKRNGLKTNFTSVELKNSNVKSRNTQDLLLSKSKNQSTSKIKVVHRYKTNNDISKVQDLENKRKSSGFSTISKKSDTANTYKTSSKQRDSFNSKKKLSESKNSLDGLQMPSKLSSTGMFNSQTKTPKYPSKTGTQNYLQKVPKGSSTRSSLQMKKKRGTLSNKSKPIYQM